MCGYRVDPETWATVQLFVISMHFLWAYDYLLTLGDEVRYSEDPPRFQVLTNEQIRYAWAGRRSWSEFSSSRF
jgi:hypothetical protein